jgi:hypothetical protein
MTRRLRANPIRPMYEAPPNLPLDLNTIEQAMRLSGFDPPPTRLKRMMRWTRSFVRANLDAFLVGALAGVVVLCLVW